jgi:hypothetical protein
VTSVLLSRWLCPFAFGAYAVAFADLTLLVTLQAATVTERLTGSVLGRTSRSDSRTWNGASVRKPHDDFLQVLARTGWSACLSSS